MNKKKQRNTLCNNGRIRIFHDVGFCKSCRESADISESIFPKCGRACFRYLDNDKKQNKLCSAKAVLEWYNINRVDKHPKI